MLILNICLQALGIMPKEMSADSEKLLERCNSMKDIREAAKKSPQLKADVIESLQQPESLISSIVQQLEPKDEKFNTYQSATKQEITELLNHIHQIDENVSVSMPKRKVLQSKEMKEFYDQHMAKKKYAFSVKKCADTNSKYHKPQRLPEEVFKEVHDLPDPVLTSDGLHYKPFHALYGTNTTERDMPSLQTKTKVGHELPFNPSAQTACRVRHTIECIGCNKPRVLHSSKKFKLHELQQLEAALDNVDFTCGSTLSAFIPDGQKNYIFARVFVREDFQTSYGNPILFFSCFSSNMPPLCQSRYSIRGKSYRNMSNMYYLF
ncbi:uncharacterized protein [Ptychodera flava]|uniref:uncharacterized protein n=1 Tax=Ptychodera flava TaxID=63121 RepID=UPI003969ED03